MSAEMCGRGESLKHVLEIGQIHTMGGLFLLRHGGPSRIGLPPPPDTHTRTHTFQVSACRASPIDTTSHPSLERKGCFVGRRVRPGRESPPPSNQLSESKRSSVSSQPLSIFLSAFVYTETTTKSWTESRGRGAPTPHRSERLKFWFVLIRVNSSFVLHRSFCSPDASTFRRSLSKGFFPRRLRIS